MRVRIANGKGARDWRDMGPAPGFVHPWRRQRRDIDEQLTRTLSPRRTTQMPQVNATIERAA